MSLVIVGAGPAGLLAAIAASEKCDKIALFSKNPNPGKKVAAIPFEDFYFSEKLSSAKMAARFGEKADFVAPIFNAFGYSDLVKLFRNFKLNLEPDSNGHFRANGLIGADLIKALKEAVVKRGIKLSNSCRVTDIITDNGNIKGIVVNNSVFPATRIILATGSFSSPKFGATRDGYEISRNLGHHVTELKPALVDLVTVEKYGKILGGITLDDVMIGIFLNSRKIHAEIGRIRFTKTGISGPVVLNNSADIIEMLGLGVVEVRLDFMPDRDRLKFETWLTRQLKLNQHIQIGQFLRQYFSDNIIRTIELESRLKLDKSILHITNLERKSLVHAIKDFRLTIKTHKPFNNTRGILGGVSTDDIDPYTMQSKKIKSLYFAGDIIDVLGPYGGYNMQFAFSSGYLAGISASSAN